jgi:hypothetical protein
MAKHQDDDAILIQATTTGKRNITPESSPASSCKGRASRHGPKAIFGPKLLNNHEIQGLGVSESAQTSFAPLQTSFAPVQCRRRPKRPRCEHLRREDNEFSFFERVAKSAN